MFGNQLGSQTFAFFCGDEKAKIMTTPKTAKSKPALHKKDRFDDNDLPEKIGKNLRQMYNDVLSEPVPDDFLSLLQMADEKRADE